MKDLYFTCPDCGAFVTVAAAMVSEACPNGCGPVESTNHSPDPLDVWELPYTAENVRGLLEQEAVQ